MTDASLAIVRDYDGLRLAVRRRRRQLGLTLLDVDFAAGLQDGYAAKLECGVRNFGDMSLAAVLETLDLELVVRARNPRQTSTEIKG
jgi:hypothetical protein